MESEQTAVPLPSGKVQDNVNTLLCCPECDKIL